MPQNESAKKTIKYLEELEENTEVVKFDLSKSSSRNILREYIKEHTKGVIDKKTNEKKRVSDLSFNDFIKQHPDYKEQCEGKVVVAEITGGKDRARLGFDENDKYSDLDITIDGGDFTGCKFSNVEFCAMDNVSIRDGKLENVIIYPGKYGSLDLRGSNLDQCQFFSDGNTDHSFDNVQLDIADPDHVQDLGAFDIVYTNLYSRDLANAENKIDKERTSEIQKCVQRNYEESYQNKTLLGWVASSVKEKVWDDSKHPKNFKVNTDFIELEIKEIKKKYSEQKQKEIAQIIEAADKTREFISKNDISKDFSGTDFSGVHLKYRSKKAVLKDIMDVHLRYDKEQKKAISKYAGQFFTKKDLSESVQKEISDIEDKYKEKLKKEKAEIRKENIIRLTNSRCDPTYTPNQSIKRANAIKVNIKTTKEDLQEYKAYVKNLEDTKNSLSFNEFIANKNSEEIREKEKSNPNRMVISIADLSKEDLSEMKLSGLDLSGVNMSYCNMEQSDLEGTNLKGSCLEGANLTRAKMQNAELTDCNMIGITSEGANLNDAIMIRTRVNYGDLKGASMENVVGYQASFIGSNMELADMKSADMRYANLQHANLNYVDAQYAKLQHANLSKSVANHANFYRANLSDAVLNDIQARETNFEGAVLDGVKAHFADLRNSNLTKVQAKKANFSLSDLRGIKAQYANFEKAILDKADLEFAKFEKTVLKDVKAREANFKNAVLKDIDGTRIDVSGSILENANFENAKLKKAVMKNVQARKANFRKAFLEKANLQNGVFVGTDFKEANLANTAAQGGVFLASDFEKANISHMKIDEATILIDANLRGIIGDDETVRALRDQQKSQHKLQGQWFGKSRYGVPNIDERGDRFKCQRLGAAVLSAAIGGGAGVTLAGPLAGISTAALTALISDKALTATKEHYFSDLGYINNALGDRLAEVGAVALSMGIGAADRAIDGAVAGVVCSFAGAVQGTVLTAAGVGTALGGLKLAMDGVKQQSKWKKYTGMALSGVGAVASFFGISSLGASLNTIAYGAAIGGITGGLWAGASSARRLYEYKEDDKGAVFGGARPEQIYKESINRAKGIWRKIIPTMKKVMLGLALAAVAAAVVVAVIYAIPALPFVGAFGTAVIAGNAGLTAAAAGFFTGYLFDDKIIPTKKSQETKGVEKEKEVKKIYGREAYNQEKGKNLEHEKSKTEHKDKKIASKSKLTPEASEEKLTHIKTSVKKDALKESTKHQKKEEKNVTEPVKSQTEIPKGNTTQIEPSGKMTKKFAKDSSKSKTFVERIESEEPQINKKKTNIK